MKRLVVDIDETLCHTKDGQYHESQVVVSMRERLIAYREAGFEIVLYTSRNVRTFASNIGKINAKMLPTLINWLDKHDIPYDEIHVGKPWCGYEGFYVDDKAIRPDEFVSLAYTEIRDLLEGVSERMRVHTAIQGGQDNS